MIDLKAQVTYRGLGSDQDGPWIILDTTHPYCLVGTK